MAALLEVFEAMVRFGGLIAVNDVSLRVGAGEICALIGPNGAGKTTLFNAIAGYVPLNAGRILLHGTPIQDFAPHRIAAGGVRRTFQNGGLFGHLTALENVLVGLHTQVESGFFGVVLGSRRSGVAEATASARGRKLLDLMDLGHIADQPAHRRLEQPFLVGEIVGDQARRYARSLRDRAKRGLRETHICDRIDGRIDELAPPQRLGVDPEHGAIIE